MSTQFDLDLSFEQTIVVLDLNLTYGRGLLYPDAAFISGIQFSVVVTGAIYVHGNSLVAMDYSNGVDASGRLG